MNILKVQRRADALREGVAYATDDGLKFMSVPRWTHIGDGVASVSVEGAEDNDESRMVELLNAYRESDDANLYTSDPRILLHNLKWLLTVSEGFKHFDMRRPVDDLGEATTDFANLEDQVGDVIASRWSESI